MKTYKVTTQYATFGIGIVLQLSESQAAAREHSLIKKGKNTFEVIDPVQFKSGEVIGLVKGQISRFLEDRLVEMEKKEKPHTPKTPSDDNENGEKQTQDQGDDDKKDGDENNASEFPKLEHVRFGQYNVYDKDGKQVNTELLKKEEAELLLEELEAEDGV